MHKMMKKTGIVTYCMILSCALAGCQLARESAGTNISEDRLVGLFVTTEHLDLLDSERHATLASKTLVDDETGEKIETKEYIFEDVDGMAFFSPTIQATAEHEGYGTSMIDEAISDSHTGIHVDDANNSSSKTMEGTIYFALPTEETILYYNPVFQCSDGSVYLNPSYEGFAISNSIDSEGGLYSQTMDESYTMTENGKTMTNSVSVKISISLMFAPEKFVILQMDSDNKLILRTEYSPDALPDAITLEKNAEYVIAETRKRGGKGVVVNDRDIYGRDDETIEAFFARADGFCVKKGILIK